MLVVSDHTPAFEGGPVLMLSERSSVDIHALKRQGMTISEIARRTHHDRKTIRAYLSGERIPGKRERAAPDRVRRVRRLRHGAADRGPASVGGDAARRARTAGLSGVVSDADPADPGPRSAAGLHGLRARHETTERDHRAPARGGDPVRLARAARPARAVGVPDEAGVSCWSGRSRTPVSGGRCSRRRWTSRICWPR